MPLNAVRNASHTKIVEALEELKSDNFLLSKWLSNNNVYKNDIIEVLKVEFRKKAPLVPRFYYKNLRHYTAASMVLHNSDGWTFLARAVDSVLAGDIGSAVFFAYYAELRALMSMFAGNGICILDKPHLYIKRNGKAEKFCPTNGTHTAVLEVLKEWIKDNNRTNQLLNWIRVDNTSLQDWLTKSGRAFRITYLAKDWLEKWSVDVTLLTNDHNTRNEVSYRPNTLSPERLNFDYKENILKVLSFLDCCEPSNSDSFYELDKHLLRISLESVFDSLPFGASSSNGNRVKKSKAYKKDFEKFINPLLSNLGKSNTGFLKDFLIRNNEPEDPQILFEAKKPNFDKATNTYQPTPMISRALLLLRLASGNCESMLKESNIKKDDLEFWWGKYGNKHGFWSENNFPDDLKDAWADLRDSLKNIRQFCASENIVNIKSFEKIPSEDILRFKQINRVALWGIGL
ncbi:KaiC/GvpD/RAD55 family RecA-like ATPase [Mucilaginibacter sp. SG538B]|uniref:hypothetical protein n=1 Tax=Mucilaginibacter sp. SG538B TaxID=2587021 RepID=UPI00159E01A0|nr:hypothetical protein [Mucilaginibacter sp. SG538B]NVM63219.1 KaiC/GvpD/RAD55 family RecA-like ATPase [Mucilaginibacter sp. SG538B]